jgi:hypothetical protein
MEIGSYSEESLSSTWRGIRISRGARRKEDIPCCEHHLWPSIEIGGYTEQPFIGLGTPTLAIMILESKIV